MICLVVVCEVYDVCRGEALNAGMQLLQKARPIVRCLFLDLLPYCLPRNRIISQCEPAESEPTQIIVREFAVGRGLSFSWIRQEVVANNVLVR